MKVERREDPSLDLSRSSHSTTTGIALAHRAITSRYLRDHIHVGGNWRNDPFARRLRAIPSVGWLQRNRQAPAPYADKVELPLGSAHSGLRSRACSRSNRSHLRPCLSLERHRTTFLLLCPHPRAGFPPHLRPADFARAGSPRERLRRSPPTSRLVRRDLRITLPPPPSGCFCPLVVSQRSTVRYFGRKEMKRRLKRIGNPKLTVTVFCLYRLPRDRLHLRHHQRCGDSQYRESVQRRQHPVLFLRLYPPIATTIRHARLGMGWLFGQHRLRFQILP